MASTSIVTDAPPKAGIVSIGNHFTDGTVHLISNYWGMDSFLDCPELPEECLKMVHVSTASKRYAELGKEARFLDAERAWVEAQKKAGRIAAHEYCVAGKTEEEICDTLGAADVIFMGGGNTQYLLQELQDTGADEIIRRLVLKEGKWYLGKSAGAIVAGPDIDPRGFFMEPMTTHDLDDTTALGLTDVFPLPHIDTPSIMNTTWDGKTGWQHAIEMTRACRTAYILDDKAARDMPMPVVAAA